MANSIKIKYDPFAGAALPDGRAKEIAQEIAKGMWKGISFGNFLLIENLRLLLIKGEINELIVIYNNQELKCNNEGNLPFPPPWEDYYLDILVDIMNAKQDMKKITLTLVED